MRRSALSQLHYHLCGVVVMVFQSNFGPDFLRGGKRA